MALSFYQLSNHLFKEKFPIKLFRDELCGITELNLTTKLTKKEEKNTRRKIVTSVKKSFEKSLHNSSFGKLKKSGESAINTS